MIERERIGFIGLGAMGRLMAGRLLDSRFHLTAYDIRPDALEEFRQKGAAVAGSAEEVGSSSDKVIIMVRDHRQIEEVIFEAGGLLQAPKPPSIMIIMSTISPVDIRQIARRTESRGIKLLDAPVSGGVSGAASGNLAIMVGGPEDAVRESLSVLRAMGKNVFHVGETGMGQTAKLINQMLVSINLIGVCEAALVSLQLRMDPKALVEVIEASAGDSWIFRNVFLRMADRHFDGQAFTSHLKKDTELLLKIARENRWPLLFTNLANQIFQMAEAHGLGEQDHASIIKLFEMLSGKPFGDGSADAVVPAVHE